MITAIDTSVLLDVVLNDTKYADSSEAALNTASLSGTLIICESVIAELAPAFSSTKQLSLFLTETGIEFIPQNKESALLAGEHYALYLKNKGSAKRVLPDFLITSHAHIFADKLLARDRGYYREYFNKLVIIQP